MITDRVKNTILNNGLIQKGEHIVIGLSGGPDSVCLFHILYRLREELGIRLHAVHVNHGLRPGAADEDQQYVEALCAEYQIPCHSFYYDVNLIAKDEGLSGEDAGRQVRYLSFFEVASRIAAETGGSVKIAVAQNMNDQAETVLMRIIRGTGTDGLAGIEYLRTEKGKGVVIRPLLDVTREEIETYCSENNLDPRIDLTNLEPVYTRNRIRLELLPYLNENFNTNIMAVLNRLSKIAKEDRAYFSQRVEEIIAKHAVFRKEGQVGAPVRLGMAGSPDESDRPGRAAVPLAVLSDEHPAIRHRLIITLFEMIGLSKDITAAHLEQADRLLQEGKTSSSADFTAGYAMRVSYRSAEFYKKTEPQNMDFEYEININMEGITGIPELNAEIGVKILKRQDWIEPARFEPVTREPAGNRAVCRLSLDKIIASAGAGGRKLVLRTRRRGDYIVPLGMRGRKKLQDLFVDEKYPAEERDRIPLLCLGPEAVWAIWPPGGRISENFKVEDSTETIILLEFLSKI